MLTTRHHKMNASAIIIFLLGVPVGVGQGDVAHFHQIFGHHDVGSLTSEAVMKKESLDLARQLASNAGDIEWMLTVGKRLDFVVVVSRQSNHDAE